jgi:hypothetical protein
MTDDEKVLIAKTICRVINNVLGGPSGDPDDCHLSAAASCYELIDQLDLHAAMRDVDQEYDSSRSEFFDKNSEFFPEYLDGDEEEDDEEE